MKITFFSYQSICICLHTFWYNNGRPFCSLPMHLPSRCCCLLHRGFAPTIFSSSPWIIIISLLIAYEHCLILLSLERSKHKIKRRPASQLCPSVLYNKSYANKHSCSPELTLHFLFNPFKQGFSRSIIF